MFLYIKVSFYFADVPNYSAFLVTKSIFHLRKRIQIVKEYFCNMMHISVYLYIIICPGICPGVIIDILRIISECDANISSFKENTLAGVIGNILIIFLECDECPC